ncbi:MAG TPA: Ig-like domain-containing protein [Candidatus Eisenbacteria bacterium]|nr:Ig-like domain-containing protein [Candidatus Eisenbacteria bacterium]
MIDARGGRSNPARLHALLLLAALAGCARPIPPPGGPIDTTPPRVVATSPADSATGVARRGNIEILFSESMEHSSVRDNVRIYPPIDRPSFGWSGRRFRVEWADSLDAGTTYQLFLSGRARDLRGVPLGIPLVIRFSTGAALAPGRIEGRIRAKTLPTRGVPVLLLPDSLGLRPDTTDAFEPVYQTESDTAGVYRFSGLPLDRGFTVQAFYDRNGDSFVDPEGDVVAGYGEVVRLTPERMVADSINIVAVDPRAQAILSGTVASPDSSARFVVEAREASDSTVVARMERKGPGPFTLRVPAGHYRLNARRLAAVARPTMPARAGAAARGEIPEASVALPEEIVVGPEDERGPFVLTLPPAPVPAPEPAPEEESR